MVQMNRFAGQKLRHRCREQMHGHQGVKAVGCGGDGDVMNWAIGIDMYTLMCTKLMTNKNLLYKKILKKDRNDIHLFIYNANTPPQKKTWQVFNLPRDQI